MQIQIQHHCASVRCFCFVLVSADSTLVDLSAHYCGDPINHRGLALGFYPLEPLGFLAVEISEMANLTN